MFEFANNESAFEALLESIKQASNNIKRDAGTRFETLIKDWLTQDQSYLDFPITLHSSLRICIYFLNFFKNLLHFRVFLFIIECTCCTR